MSQFYPSRGTIQEATDYVVRLLGTGAANPTKQEGEGVTATWVSTGLYKLVFAENPFQFVSAVAGLLATTVGDLKGYSVVFEDYSSASSVYSIRFAVYNSSFALADLAATQRLCLTLKFQRTGY